MISPVETESTHRRAFLEGLRGRRASISLVEGRYLGTNSRREFFNSPEGKGLQWAVSIVDTLAKLHGLQARANARDQGFFGTDEDGLVRDAVDYSITLKQPLFGTGESDRTRLTKRLALQNR